MEARFYSDAGSGWLFYEVKQCRLRLVPGLVTSCLTSRTTRQMLHLVAAIGGMGNDITIISGPMHAGEGGPGCVT